MIEIVLDGCNMHSIPEAHAYMADMLSFPDYYGKNLDALHDCLGDISEPTNIILKHWDELEDFLGNYATALLQVFEDSASENPSISIEFRR
ncbi:MAG: barstar family protein [Clostridiales bacterium]|nr:barstar family protein [Clostridiales bacterium]